MKRDAAEALPRAGGVLVVDKPRGPTSHDVVARLRRALGTREIGHCGTLDPMATGVLVVALGQATKLSPYLTAEDKAYETTIVLGTATDTLDAEGKVTDQQAPSAELLEALRSPATMPHPLVSGGLAVERARTLQVPPAYSAIKQGGQRSYALARSGKEAPLSPRAVAVRSLTLLASGADAGAGEAWLTLSLDVAKGYYVRALARDLAESLGTVGHLTALRRTRSGCFTLDESVPLDTPADELAARVLPIEHAASRALPVTRLTAVGARDASFGRAVRATELEGPAPAGAASAWLDPQGKVVAIGERQPDGTGRVLRGFEA